MSQVIERLETECNDYKNSCEMQDSIIGQKDDKLNLLLQELYEKEQEMEKQRTKANNMTSQVIMGRMKNVFQLSQRFGESSQRSEYNDAQSLMSSRQNQDTFRKMEALTGMHATGTPKFIQKSLQRDLDKSL